MATKLTTFDFSPPSAITASEKAIYPWEEWLDGDIWKLEEGEDFETHPLMMERIIRTRATARGAKVRMRHLPLPENLNGKRKRNPFGIIVLQRTDVVGPNEIEAEERAKAAKKAEAAEKRAAKKALAAKEADELLKAKGIKTVTNGNKPRVSKRPSRPAAKATK